MVPEVCRRTPLRALNIGTMEWGPGRRSWRFCGTIFPCGSSNYSPRASWAECVTGRRRVTILPSVTSFAANMLAIAPGVSLSVIAGACATARALLLDRPARRRTADKTAPRLRLRCPLSSGNAQRRRRSHSDDPRHGTIPRATGTSQPVQSPCPRHHPPAPRCHPPGPATRRLPASGTAQSAVRARTRTRPHRIRTDPRRERRHPQPRADQTAMPRPARPHRDTVIDQPGKRWQPARSSPIRTR
jgi:hypothetical protein